MNQDDRVPQELDLTKPRLASYKQKWKRHQDAVYWVDIQLAQRKGLKFFQTRCNAIIFYDTLPAYCISKVSVMKYKLITYRKLYVSPRPPSKISHNDNWMNGLDSEATGSSKDTQRIQPKPKTQISRTGRSIGGQEFHKEIAKGTMFDHVRTSSTQQVRGDPYVWIGIHKKLRVDAYRNWRRSNKNGETRKGGGARHWLQSTTTVTHSCNGSRTSPSSRTRQKDRNSSSSSSTSCRLAAEQCLQPMQEKFEGVDPRIGWCGVIRVVRNYTKCTMFSMSSFLESRNCVLHLRTVFDWQRIQKKVQQTTTGCTLYPELRDKERMKSWCSTWQNRSTKSIPPGLEESRLSRWKFYRCSRSISQRSSLSWITTRNRMDRTKVKRAWTNFAKEDFSYPLTLEEKRRYQAHWYLTLKKSGKNGLMKLRSDFRAAVSLKNRLLHESGEQIEEPISPEQIQYMASLFKHIVVEQELQLSS